MKKQLLTAAAVSASLSGVQAQITHFDINQTILPGGNLFLDFDDGIYNGSADEDLRIYFFDGAYIENVSIYGYYSIWRTATTGGFATRYAPGASLAFANTAGSSYLTTGDAGPWNADPGTATAYLALLNSDDGRRAWVGLRYDDAANSLFVESFAVAPGSVNLTAGMTAVPEPAETAALMALLAGGAAIYHRRRQRKLAQA